MKPRLLQFLLTLAVIGLFAYSLPGAIDQQFARAGMLSEREPAVGAPMVSRSESLYQGLTAREWAGRAVRNRKGWNQERRNSEKRGRTIRRLKAAMTVTPRDHSLRAISYASTAYGVSYPTLLRKAFCETGGTFDPYAKNPRSTASGLFQFLTSTWATTPYARMSIWDPYANALAAAWMHAHGRGGEWVCR